ncbi:MAG: hemolysin family protein [Actinomycetota bacterium]
MTYLWLPVGVLVVLGTLLALTESSITRITRVRAWALKEEGRRNAELLERMASDPPRTLNAIYLAVMVVQNGSAIVVAIIAEHLFDSLGVTLTSIGFTLLYFVVVEAMAKTFGVLHTDRVALALAPFAYAVARVLDLPTKALIGLANLILPGKGLREGPFVSEEDIRHMASAGSEEGSIEEEEEELIHSVFEFGDTVVREVMRARPDVVAIPDTSTLRDVQETVLREGFSRLPVFHGSLDDVVGIIFAKDVLKAVYQGLEGEDLTALLRPARFVPESKKAADLLREMQAKKFHFAVVLDEHGSVVGIVTLEDLLEELVGEITDEYDPDEAPILAVGTDEWLVAGRAPISEVAEELEAELPEDEWDTIAGFVLDLLGEIPKPGESAAWRNLTFTVLAVDRRRIDRIRIRRVARDDDADERGGAS